MRRLTASALAAVAVTGSVLGFAAPAAAGADTTAPSAPVLLSVFGYQCLEINVLANRSVDDATPQAALVYEVYADGVLVGEVWDRGWPFIRGAAYVLAPGVTSVTLAAVDAAGNRSVPSNAVTTATEPC
jgi:hypothetical protein